MKSALEQLSAIGFAKRRSEPVCWRSVRVDRTPLSDRGSKGAPEPSCSSALLGWRELLARGARPSPYRITRIEK